MSEQKWKRPNAYKHGAFSATAILPGEDEREFEELHSALVDEWKPIGATEEDAVLSIAKAVWRKRRVQKFLTAQCQRHVGNPSHVWYDESIGLRALAAYVKENPATAFEHAKRFLHQKRIADLKQKIPRSKFQSSSEWAEALLNEIGLLVTDFSQSEGAKITALYQSSEALSGDLFRQELALDERLDAMIDRAVKRLIQIKAMKQILSQASAE